MSYIVFDLEWNQASSKDKEVKGIMFEILEIGAVRMDESFRVVDVWSSLVRPQVYMTMHNMTRKIVHLDLRAMRSERPFPVVMEEFLKWCGDSPVFCTWGPSDLTELARNMQYYGMAPLSRGPLKYLDVQKLFALGWGDGRSRLSLEAAAGQLGIDEPEDFHTALGDARYTADILAKVADEEVLRFHSYDNFHLPGKKSQEIHEYFPGYSRYSEDGAKVISTEPYYKYISRSFRDRTGLLADMEVCAMRCPVCKKKAHRVVKWFSPNGGRYFLSVSSCQEHGFLKGKLRVKKGEKDRLYAVKTIKPIDPELAESIREKYRAFVIKNRKSV